MQINQKLRHVLLALILIGLYVLALFVSGCASQTQQIHKVHFDDPAPLQLYDYKFKIIYRNNLQDSENVQSVETNICLNPEGYANLAKNVQELKRYIIQQKDIIKAYREIYK